MTYQYRFRLIVLVILAIFLITSSYGYTLYNNSVLGSRMASNGEIVDSNSLSEEVKDLQDANAESSGQLDTSQQIYEIKKNNLLKQANEAWDLILGMFILLRDFVVLLVYLFEMRLILFIFVELIPMLFVKLRDSLTNFYVHKRDSEAII